MKVAKRCQSPMLTSQHTLMAALGLARRQRQGTEPSPPSPRSAQRGVCAGSHGKAGCVLTFLWGQGLWCQEAAPSHSLCAWARCKEAAAPRGSQVEQQCYSISGTEGAQQTRTSPAAELWKQHVMLQCALQSTAQPGRQTGRIGSFTADSSRAATPTTERRAGQGSTAQQSQLCQR